MPKYLVIGGVAGGATAAARLRRLDEKASIILFERGDYVSYANCGLPYYAGGVIKERSKLFVMTPELLKQTLAIDVRTGSEVLSIDTAAKKVSILEKQTGRSYEEPYDALVLSPGAEPLRPKIPGIDDKGIYTLRSVPDIDGIKEELDARRPERVVVVGAGFIGLEMAENLHERGIFVTIVEALDQVMNPIDFEMAAIVHQHLKSKGIELYLSDSVTAFERKDGKLVVNLKSGVRLPSDMVILSIGVRPDTKLAREAGIVLDQKGYIVTDTHMRTSDSAIYAVGDAVSFISPLTGRPTAVPLAGPANKQARIAADNIAGNKAVEYHGAIGTSIAKVFDLTVACTGLPEKVLQKEGIAHTAVIVHPQSHAGYYPGAKPFSLKLVYDPNDGRILGAQAVGYEGVDKRIDVIAAFIAGGAHIEALTEFEHAYAPPFASAKDPVNYAGFVAENLLQGKSAQVRWNEVEKLKAEGAFLLDVRTPEEFALGHIEGAVNISNTVLRQRLDEVPRDKFVLVYCGVGIRGYMAERILRQNGWTSLANLSGGWKTYEAAIGRQDNTGIFRPGAPGLAKIDRGPVSYAEGSGMPEPMASRSSETIVVDACGLQCPGPIMRLKTEVDRVAVGTTIVVRATDPGFVRDAKSWCTLTGNELRSIEDKQGTFEAIIVKSARSPESESASSSALVRSVGKEATFIVFSDDLDKALASFILANGAAALGKKVTMFFTFWGLSVIRRRDRVPGAKDFMSRMFGLMLPRGSQGLALSHNNFAGLGPAMMRKRMKQKQVDQLDTMIAAALGAGVHMTACQMSMDLLGISREELIGGVEVGGVATYFEAASSANVNLFI
jgi:NADPH-dependent 2,4-dienoyl-CoA reductase/sulfur reductase-like enzyme/peroxiredoxin family protein/TusA-related sulfurtransferase/rhodanese-related sulfurtransferase